MAAYDLVIVGAGPAGMGAAVAAREWNLSVLVLDEQPAPGGQIYRGIEQHTERQARLDPGSVRGRELATRFRACGVDYRPGASVWFVAADGEVAFSVDGCAHRVRARRLLLATGAMERPWPLPGWTLPGVMTAGAAQILMKTTGLVHRDPVFAGSGPLLYLVAMQYRRVGVPVRAVLDTTPFVHYAQALPHLPAAMRTSAYLRRGLGLLWHLRRSGTPVFTGVRGLRALGRDTVEAVDFQHRGRHRRLEGVTGLFLHQGVVPHIHASLAAGCERTWDARNACWRLVADAWGRTSQPHVFVAGDAAAITGAASAPVRGRLVALAIAHDLGKVGGDAFTATSRRLQRDLARDAAVRPFLDTLYRPADECLVPTDDDTMICRCEEVRVRDVRRVIDSGSHDPNQVKSALRCGMGPCQGRLCALTLANRMADAAYGEAIPLPLRQRPPVVPVPLSELVGLLDEPESTR
ncbi:FAD-dependent pyridine nucleotide-disulfide oxidoreductase [Burkholderia pseudomallei]|uniref:NAD(P)/FAD-dependent oxidoreductase n=1 Tax=Burkholderia pseudomallei TaxID=28450 RepID=UPI000F060126|nr:FAD/NAD(P)-binding oxidoreductase [Burkholderia pseudomallei]CAJ2750027.1 FAD-dependent pyridine nucleotide-disulfide oxidoreductase [Burkholderia pseudomallei]VCJ93181.1 FAD-dependent pyridine nucleotide-disulfide oxidoreductase [Burkholderia pseudomallei]VCJ94982.1 FAD-dependent pyridine nucleotide-disulfide oxidoreductase [Burkholderia pseudomallei]VCJ95693.1 FAD-dependent pyridine nucleotide-disulfide oxidoreductase [Burkholderia pseudomallei]VCJ97516.1 FAD-dependent pyridine nucleotide